jgi:hypothetical protein
MTRKLISILFLSVLFISCKKEDIQEMNITGGYYGFVEGTTDIPVDLNNDGVKNTDLTKEVPPYLIVTGNAPYIGISARKYPGKYYLSFNTIYAYYSQNAIRTNNQSLDYLISYDKSKNEISIEMQDYELFGHEPNENSNLYVYLKKV